MQKFVRRIAAALSACLMLSVFLPSAGAQGVTVQARTVTYVYSGQTYTGNAFMNGTSVVPDALYTQGSTYVPIRLVAEMLSLTIQWKSPDIEITTGGTPVIPITTQASIPSKLTVQIFNAHIVIGGQDVTPAGGLFNNGLSTVPVALYYKGTSYVPLRFVDSQLGLSTAWDGATHTITITQNKSSSSTGQPPVVGSVTVQSPTLAAGGNLQATIPVPSTNVSWWLQDQVGNVFPIFQAQTSAINAPLPANIGAGSYTLYAQDNTSNSPVDYTATVQIASSWTGLVNPADNQPVIDPFYVYNWEDISPLYEYGFSGQGETIALFEMSDLQAADLSLFDQAYGLPAPNLSIQDPYGDPGVQSVPQPFASPLDETTLDVEWAHAIAPYANIVLYLYPSSAQPSDIASAIKNAQQAGDVSFSASFGYAGDATSAVDAQVQAAVQTGTIAAFASTGDHGTSSPLLSWPATNPYVISVGGTQINNAYGSNAAEAYWNQGTDQNGVLWAGGYGYSDYPIPTWQQAVVTGKTRYLPDVSFLARDALVYEDGQWVADGGTSLASPSWAAIWSLVMQFYQSQTGKTALPVPAPEALYNIAAADGTTYKSTPAFYPNGSGLPFDPQLGLGVPDVSNLAIDVSQLK